MPVRRVIANEKVEADRGRVALMRGPMVFCVEGADVDGRQGERSGAADDARRWRPSFAAICWAACK